MWKEDIRDRRVTVALSGKDLIVDTGAVKAYLADTRRIERENGSLHKGIWEETGLDVLWFPELDHGQVFDKKSTRARLVDITRSYCDSE